MVRAPAIVACVVCLLPLAAGLDAKWTPNGEAPAPFSTRARQEMGIDPQSFAGQTQATKQVTGTLGLSVGSLLTVYICNNWKLVIMLKEFIMTLLKPFLNSAAAKREAQARMDRAAAADSARKARLSRIQAMGTAAKSTKKEEAAEDENSADDDDLE